MAPQTFNHVLFPTDFSARNEPAFAIAAKLALHLDCRLSIVHSESHREDDDNVLAKFPGVRETFRRWGLDAQGSETRPGGPGLGLRINKVSLAGGEPVKALSDFVDHHSCDLMVMATEARAGLSRWLQGSVAGRVARRAVIPCLFVPDGAAPLVDPESGMLAPLRIVVPVAQDPSPKIAQAELVRLLNTLGDDPVMLDYLYVGSQDNAPAIPKADLAGSGDLVCKEGPLVETIVAHARAREASLIAMATQGRHGFIDALQGSTTEQVLREARIPLLAVPE